ncbi:MAG: DUF1153 domain-containing protein [Alphaproteobacteria bacterium]|nr:MAG: DUF1153 domain-containing protein [Alphaproteobacteria bacterium]
MHGLQRAQGGRGRAVTAGGAEPGGCARPDPADLPPPDTRRWVASRKLAVVRAVLFGLLSREAACARWALSSEELDSWISHALAHGFDGLKATRIGDLRRRRA